MKIETKKLKAALDVLKPIVGRRNTIPVLSAVKLESSGKLLRITVSNLDEYASESVECDEKLAATCINFDSLYRSLGAEEINLMQSEGSIAIEFGGDEVTLQTMLAEDFPAIPKMEGSKKHGASCRDVGDGIDMVSWSACDDASRYALQAVRIESEAKVLSIVATDGRQLAKYETKIIGSKFGLNVPAAFSSRLAESLRREGTSLSSNKNWIRVDHESGFYMCKQNEANYPNWRNVIPKEKIKLGMFQVADALSVSGFCNAFNDKNDKSVKLKFSQSGIEFNFNGAMASMHRTAKGEFLDFEIAVSLKRLHEIFSRLKTVSAEIYHSGDELSRETLVIEAADLTVVLTPMRLS